MEKIKNQENNKVVEDDNLSDDLSTESADSGKKIAEWAIIGLALGFVIVAVGFFSWNKYYQNQKEISNLKSQIENLKQVGDNSASGNSSGQDSSAQGDALVDEYVGWKTYTNSEVGYMLRYPSDWTLKETSGKSEVTGSDIKYITIDTPDNKYFLYFGLRKKSDSFSMSDRTGVGAGEIQDSGSATVLDTEITIRKLVYKNKINELFFGAINSNPTADGNYVFAAGFGSHIDTYSGSGIDPNLTYIGTSGKILASVKLIERAAAVSAGSGSACAPIFTAEEKLNMKGWKTFANTKYGFSFTYPNDWPIKNSSQDNVSLGDKDDAVTFQIKSGNSPFGLESYKLGSKKLVKIACKDVTITSYIADPKIDPSFAGDERMIITSFEKGGTAHTIFFTYKDIGASISSDIIEAFNLILKSINYVQ